MEQLYITNIEINKVRHLKNIAVSLRENQIRHLVLTGKNGSGKTSVVEALARYLHNLSTDQFFVNKESWLVDAQIRKKDVEQRGGGQEEIVKLEKEIQQYNEALQQSRNGLNMKKVSLSDEEMNEIAELELYLDEIPDYLAIDISTEYQRLKVEFMNREDIDG